MAGHSGKTIILYGYYIKMVILANKMVIPDVLVDFIFNMVVGL